jgi:dTMP kinase
MCAGNGTGGSNPPSSGFNLAITLTMSLFITLEGIEGSGKTTLAGLLREALLNDFSEIVITREPGGSELGKKIRALLLEQSDTKISPFAELLLFSADRAQHLDELIRPALERNACVICDRFTHSTLAYQGYARGLDLKMLESVNQLVTAGQKPDLTLLLDLDPQVGLQRVTERHQKQGEWNRFDEEKLQFHQKVRNGFLELAKNDNIIKVLDATKTPDQLMTAALAAIRTVVKDSGKEINY